MTVASGSVARGESLGQCPVEARPAEESQHHRHGAHGREEHRDAQGALVAVPQCVECPDTGANPQQRQEPIDCPDEPPLGTGGEQAREHVFGGAVEDLQIAEPRGEIGEDHHERRRAADQGGPAHVDDREASPAPLPQ